MSDILPGLALACVFLFEIPVRLLMRRLAIAQGLLEGDERGDDD